jgi:hypothetical protein
LELHRKHVIWSIGGALMRLTRGLRGFRSWTHSPGDYDSSPFHRRYARGQRDFLTIVDLGLTSLRFRSLRFAHSG